jgi:antitoxin HicB
MAYWNALGTQFERRVVGSALQPAKPKDRTVDSVLSRKDPCRAARLHQKDAEDTGRGLGNSEAANEGGYTMTKRNKHIGSSLDSFLKEEGVLEETRAIALKDAVAWQVQQAMEKEKITKVEMAKRMHTSRAALDRLLTPGNASVTLQTLTRAARAVGRDLRIELL